MVIRTENYGSFKTKAIFHGSGGTEVVLEQSRSRGFGSLNTTVGGWNVDNNFSRTFQKHDHSKIYGKIGNVDFVETRGLTEASPVLYSSPSYTGFASRVLANGPLQPRVNVPLFIFEMKDIPSMLRHAGNLLHKIARPSGLSPAKEAAAATLAYQFGWGPLIDDLGKLLDFSSAVAKTQDRIRRANSHRGVRVKTNLFSDTAQGNGSTSVWSAGGTQISQTWIETRSIKIWGTCRWKVKDLGQIGKTPSYNEALRVALGLNAGNIPITVWKAIPWTWLIDWFTGISNILQANYNRLYYTPSKVCIMEFRETVRTYIGKPLPGYPIGGKPPHITSGSSIHVSKQRTVVSPSLPLPTLALPFLDGFKLSILGSLTILAIQNRR